MLFLGSFKFISYLCPCLLNYADAHMWVDAVG